jgi:NADPH:quinone reductase-like Zn-dependent oxidoreductase
VRGADFFLSSVSASGGVGLAFVELAHLLGARVIAAVGNAAKEMVVREYGADEVIAYSREDVRERVKALLDCCALYRRRYGKLWDALD